MLYTEFSHEKTVLIHVLTKTIVFASQLVYLSRIIYLLGVNRTAKTNPVKDNQLCKTFGHPWTFWA